ncbi:MAG: glycosyltransferase, partial [bacterium]|nr:glycosyltransferase [bacterium]
MEPKGSAGSVSTDGDVTEEPQAADPKGSDDSIAPEAGGSAVPGHREIAPLRLECDELRDRLERLDENNRELQYQLYSTRLDQLKLRSDRAGTNRSQSTAPRVGSHTRRRYVVYTAIAGGYDQVKLPLQISDEFDYVCFTDREIDDHNVWQVRRFEYLNRDPTRMARFVKMRPHVYFPEYEVSIWIDANLHLKGNPESFLINLLEKPFAAFVHPHRDCVYEEALEIISRGGLDDPTVVRDHMNRYRSQHFPDDSGLIETNVLVRRHNDPAVKRLMNLWWHQLVNGSKRDQLSLPYVLWRAGFEIEPLGKKGVSVRNDPRFERYLHGSGSEYSHPQLGPKHLERQEELEPTQGPFGQKIESGYQPIDTSVVDSLSMDIVICVHNSLDDVRRCLNSVIPTMLPHHKLIIVDDGSEKETAQYLFDLYNADSRIRLIRCEKAGGYTKAANIGLRSSEAEFTILLNSDTIVPARWWRKLATVAYSSPSTGIVGPLSNAASWQSVPKILDADGSLAVNPRPEDLSVDAMDDLVETSSINVFPVVDLLNGFCLGIKRAVVNEIGYFDEEAFPKGYGEENDYCFRAFEAGFRLVVATGCYVFHAKSRSYTPERRDSLATESGKAFRRKYPAPRIGNAIESTKKNPFLVRMRKRFESNQDAAIAEAESARAQVQTMRTITPRPLGSPAFFDVSVEQLEANQELQSRYAEEPCGEPRVALWFLPN